MEIINRKNEKHKKWDLRGGGTGIADGLIIDGQLIDFSCEGSQNDLRIIITVR